MYGKIVAEADRDIDPDMVLRRTVQFGLANYPEKSRDEQWKRFCDHLENKYSNNGYIRLWIPGSENEKKLKALREIIADRHKLLQIFNDIYQQESGD